MKNLTQVAMLAGLSVGVGAEAAIIPFAELFPTAGGVPSGWTPFVETGGTLPLLENSTGLSRRDDDGSQPQSGLGLDGNEDGALRVDSQNPLSPALDLGVYFDVAGTMDEGEGLSLVTRIFNANVSFINVGVALENVTDGVVLAESGTQLLNDPNGWYRTISLDYTATANDAGDLLRVRYTGVNINSSSRDFSIDNARLTTTPIPEPSTMLLSCLAVAIVGLAWRVV